MKAISFFIAALLCSRLGFSQTQVEKFFGERFVSVKEAQSVYKNLPDSLTIPYPEKKLMQDFESWLVPVIANGKAKYILVKPNYLSDPLLRGYDTLDMVITAKVAYMMHFLRPRFPLMTKDLSQFKFLYRTKEDCESKKGLSYKQTISFDLYNDHNFFAVALPKLMETGILEPRYISFMIEKGGKKNSLYFENLAQGCPDIAKQDICVLTMTYAK